MKKAIPYILPLGYGILTALIAACLCDASAIILALGSVYGHPIRYMLVCGVIVLVSFVTFVPLLICNYNYIDFVRNQKRTVIIELAESTVVFFVFMAPCTALFDLLAKQFL